MGLVEKDVAYLSDEVHQVNLVGLPVLLLLLLLPEVVSAYTITQFVGLMCSSNQVPKF